jgi:hypothetical protein
MVSILLRGGLAPTIGTLGGGELGGEGVREGATGNESLSGMGNNRGFREKANGLMSANASLRVEVTTVTRGGVVKIGVGKYSVVLGLRQSIASGERGVTRISPSNPRPEEENSARTLPKFRKWETSEKGMLRN